MHNNLFFICPTDHLEMTINDTFKDENYFYTSLGNSVSFGPDLAKQLTEIVEAKNIKKVFFMLSYDNPIVLNGMKSKLPSSYLRMKGFYSEIAKESNTTLELWERCDSRNIILTNLLRRRIEEFKACLNKTSIDLVINGKLYLKKERIFKDINSHPISTNLYNLN